MSTVQAVWSASIPSGTIAEYAIPQLESGTTAPVETLTASAFAVAFDRRGNLWTSNETGGTIAEYSATQLAGLHVASAPVPAVTITPPFTPGTGFAFDAAGDLWTTGNQTNTIYEFTPAQLAAGGSQTPAIALALTLGPSATTASRLTFDGGGNLWVSGQTIFGSGAPTPVLFKYARSSLAASGSAAPIAALNEPIPFPGGQTEVTFGNDVGFDASGNLWGAVAGYYFAFAPSQLDGSNPNPFFVWNLYQYSPTAGSIVVNGLSALAFDAAGDLFTQAGGFNLAVTHALFVATPAQYGAMPPTATADGGTNGQGEVVVGPYVP
jgi:hypothetical protein